MCYGNTVGAVLVLRFQSYNTSKASLIHMMPETDTVSVFTIIYIHVAQSSIWHEANTIISIIEGFFYGYTHVPDIALGFEALCTACTIGITVCTGCAVAYRNTKNLSQIAPREVKYHIGGGEEI